MNRKEFLSHIQGCMLPERFDQHLLDHATDMFEKWGKSTHMNEKEYLFETFGLASKQEDDNDTKRQKVSLRCVCTRIMEARLSRKDAIELIKNLNNVMAPGYQGLE